MNKNNGSNKDKEIFEILYVEYMNCRHDLINFLLQLNGRHLLLDKNQESIRDYLAASQFDSEEVLELINSYSHFLLKMKESSNPSSDYYKIKDELMAERAKRASDAKFIYLVSKIKNRKVFSDRLQVIVKNNPDSDLRCKALRLIEDQKTIAEIALNDRNPFLRTEAVALLNNQTVLKQIVKSDESPFIRIKAIPKIKNQLFLSHIAKNDPDVGIRVECARQLRNNIKLITEIAHNDPDAMVRRKAMALLGCECPYCKTRQEKYAIEEYKMAIKVTCKKCGKKYDI